MILAVTVLTSMDASDIHEMGMTCTVEELVIQRAQRAIAAGTHGVVASGHEASKIRALSRDVIIVTPGIRPAGSDKNEQKRAMTPAEAVHAGADYLVVGRPINRAPEPAAAAQSIIGEMQRAFDERTSASI
jgi:orotidine-5'-phosphate decarboxylase